MSSFNKLTPEQIVSLDATIEAVKANANWVDVVTPAIPFVMQVCPEATPLIVTILAVAASSGTLPEAHKKLIAGKASAEDLIAMRKSLIG